MKDRCAKKFSTPPTALGLSASNLESRSTNQDSRRTRLNIPKLLRVTFTLQTEKGS
jgi:hypothetical protein